MSEQPARPRAARGNLRPVGAGPGRLSKSAPAPSHLRPPTRAWFSETLEAYEFESHHVRLLTLAAEAWDRGAAATGALRKLGLTYNDKYGCPHPRPEAAIARDAATTFARLVRELQLDIAPPDEIRPPGMGQGRRRA